jgi:hypothetical protein
MCITRNSHHAATLLALLLLSARLQAQPPKSPSLESILQHLQSNLDRYDATLPSFFCDEHVVSQVTPGLPNQNTVTDSIFRLKRVVNRDRTSSLDESREVKAVNGKPATSQDIGGPTILDGAFEGGLAIVSLTQTACINYELERTQHKDPVAPYIIRFASVLTPQNSAACILHEESKGRVFIDPATLQITRLELTTPHHAIDPERSYESPTMGDRVLSVDYAAVQLDEQTFWMPAAISSTVTTGRGTFHAVVWSFKATYRNFHKLEVTSRILPATEPAK